MKKVIRDFKAIMADENERKEFIGSFASVVVTIAILYFAIVLFN